jgi:hypothetical protein
VLARTPELFADGTAAAPTVLSAPFDEYKEDEVARFLKCCYPGLAGVDGNTAAYPAVVRLANALDAPGLLEVVRAHYDSQLEQYAWPMDYLNVVAELAFTCGWDRTAAEAVHGIALELVAQSGPLHNAAPRAASDKNAFDGARRVLDCCHADVAAAAFGAVVADACRARAACLPHGDEFGLTELRGGDVQRALESRSDPALLDDGLDRCIDLGGRFLLPFSGNDDVAGTVESVAGEFSHLGQRWRLAIWHDEDGDACILDLYFVDGPPQWVRCELGLVNLVTEGERYVTHEVKGVCSQQNRAQVVSCQVMDGGDFRAPDASWLHRDRSLASVRILEVRNLTAEEV